MAPRAQGRPASAKLLAKNRHTVNRKFRLTLPPCHRQIVNWTALPWEIRFYSEFFKFDTDWCATQVGR